MREGVALRLCLPLCMCLCMTVCGLAFAAHPLQTEDTATQGAGHVELENGLSIARSGASREASLQPQLSWGITATADAILRPSWLRQRDAGEPTRRGWGDTDLDIKWRFVEGDALSLGLRAGVTLATARAGLGNPRGSVAPHGVLVASLAAAPFTLHANLGFTHVPDAERANIARVSAAALWAASERLQFTVDLGAEASTERARHAWPVKRLAGAVFTLRPGWDVDAGYQITGSGAATTREWLLGVTFRFAP